MLDINTLYNVSDKEYFGLINTGDLNKYVKNWKYNRPCDPLRIQNIVNTLENGSYVQNCIYLAELQNEDGSFKYVCYDGNHRLNAFKLYHNSLNVLVNIVTNINDEELKTRFRILNSSNPVPELYLDDNIDDLKSTITECVELIQKRFPNNMSKANNPRKPNFNRDKLSQQLYLFLIDKKLYYSSHKLFKLLMNLNDEYRQGNHINISKYNKTTLEKVVKTDCYLFLKDFTDDLKSI